MKRVLIALGIAVAALFVPTAAHATTNQTQCKPTNVTLTGGKVDFTTGCTESLSLVVYTAPSATFDAQTADQQKLSSYKTFQAAAGTYSGSVPLPDCYYQVDFVYGTYKTTLSANNLYGDQLIASENGGTKACQSTTTTTVQSTTTTTAAPQVTTPTTTLTTPTTVNQLEQNYGDDTIGQPVTSIPTQVSAETITTQPAVAKPALAFTGSDTNKLIGWGLSFFLIGAALCFGGYKTAKRNA